MVPWSQYNFPWSGDVVQRIDPDFFFGSISAEAGNGEVEKEVFCNEASYGRQLGLITEVLLLMADKAGLDPLKDGPLKELTEIQAAVEVIKERKKTDNRKNARRFLDKLQANQPEALKALLDEYRK